MKLNAIFTSHMVFAAGKPIRIYGEGAGRATVTFAGVTESASSDGGSWTLELPAMSYGGPYTLTADLDGEAVVLEDIFVGEVYMFAGQSNIQFKIEETGVPTDSFESNRMIRMFSTDRLEDSDHFHSEDGWVVCEREQIKYWSAIAFYTSRRVFEEKNVAVGVVTCYQGASVIESWVPAGTFRHLGIDIPPERKHTDHVYEEYQIWNRDGVLYEYALGQVMPFSLSAVVWYQGESDASVDEAEVYLTELCEMIRIWRKDFGDSALPFVIIQLADLINRPDGAWAKIQESQLEAEKAAKNVKAVVCADVCENDCIHPPTKDKLSYRVADALMGF